MVHKNLNFQNQVAENGESGLSDQAGDGLSEIEAGFVVFFVKMAQALSLPRSIGEIFGLLFSSQQPVPFDEVVSRLGVSKGSASQGLRFLVKIGAASTVFVPRDRRTFYEAETSMRKLFSSALRESLRPHLEGNRTAIDSLEELVNAEGDLTPDEDLHYEARIASLRNWNQKALQLLPLLETLFSLSSPSALLERVKERNTRSSSPDDG